MAARSILILTNRVPFPLKDGGNLAMNAMIEGYHNAGWKVYLLCMNTSRHHVGQEQLKTLYTHIHAFETMDTDNELKPISIITNFLFSREPEHAARFYNADFEARILNVIATFKPEVIQVESVYLATYLPAIREHSEALTVLRMHNVEYQIWQGLAKKSNFLKRYYLNNLCVRVRNFERLAWQSFDLLLPITEKDANLVLRLEEVNDMVVAPFSIDMAQVKQGKNEKWVGYHIGAMDWLANQEGMDWFLEKAWKRIHKAVPEFEFYFAGRNMPERYTRLHLQGVHCLNEVPSAEKFIEDKKILIVPLWSGGGIRVKILEAMAAGKVVITTRQGIKGLEAKTGEHYMQVATPDEFARAVKWCIDNKEAAGRMAQKAQELVKTRYESKAIINTVIAEIEVLLGGNRTGND